MQGHCRGELHYRAIPSSMMDGGLRKRHPWNSPEPPRKQARPAVPRERPPAASSGSPFSWPGARVPGAGAGFHRGPARGTGAIDGLPLDLEALHRGLASAEQHQHRDGGRRPGPHRHSQGADEPRDRGAGAPRRGLPGGHLGRRQRRGPAAARHPGDLGGRRGGLQSQSRPDRRSFFPCCSRPRAAGYFHRGAEVRLDWLPARQQSFEIGLRMPIFQRYIGKTRQYTVEAPLARPTKATRREAKSAQPDSLMEAVYRAGYALLRFSTAFPDRRERQL